MKERKKPGKFKPDVVVTWGSWSIPLSFHWVDYDLFTIGIGPVWFHFFWEESPHD